MSIRTVETQDVSYDLIVIGGGLAGINAAIAAARVGVRVALVHNRGVLGGNSSSEIRVWVCGATAHGAQHYARETGIMGELFVQNQFTNPEGNPYYWDLVLLEAVRAEENISLFLNTDVTEVQTEDAGTSLAGYEHRIVSVTGWQSGSERRLRFTGTSFIDATGDGLVGHLAGARYRTGRESRAELDESWAPRDADEATLGSTILFYTKDTGRPSPFVPPSFARDIAATAIPELRGIRVEANGCDYWWIEWGGDRDVVTDNEQIRDELHAAIYGIWDHIKNSGDYDADTLSLEWIGAIPGKREYRRFVGDHLLTQHDVLGQTPFADRVAHGGWSIDLHPPGGMYATEKGSRHWHPDGNYHIPLRCLYSANVANMWMAGRNISATHVALGTTRVMATCAVIGEAAGAAAALAIQQRLTPRALVTDALELVHATAIRSDASVIGLEHRDDRDIARNAQPRSSSTAELTAGHPDGTWQLSAHLGIVIPVDPHLHAVSVLLDADADTQMHVELHDVGPAQNYVPRTHLTTVAVPVARGKDQWVDVGLGWEPEHPANCFLVVRANAALRLHTSAMRVPGTVVVTHREPPADEVYLDQWRYWKQVMPRETPCLRVTPHTSAFSAQKAVGGYARPFGGPQMWVSKPMSIDPEPWLELSWPEPASIEEISVIFDDDLDEDLINLHHHRTPFRVLPTLVRDYRLEGRSAGSQEWDTLVAVAGNRQRHVRHRLEGPVTIQALRLVVTATNGASEARVVSLRAWAPSGTP